MIQIDGMSRDELSSSVDAPTWAVRAKCAERIARGYCGNKLDPPTRQAAEEAFRRLCIDAEIVVRRLLAETLKAEASLPRDIALTIATDKPEVACPFLAESPALDDSDLITIVRDNPGRHRLAIAGRRGLSEVVSGALCRSEEPGIAAAVLANETARIGTTTLRRLLETQPDPALAAAISRRRQGQAGSGEVRRAHWNTIASSRWT